MFLLGGGGRSKGCRWGWGGMGLQSSLNDSCGWKISAYAVFCFVLVSFVGVFYLQQCWKCKCDQREVIAIHFHVRLAIHCQFGHARDGDTS